MNAEVTDVINTTSGSPWVFLVLLIVGVVVYMNKDKIKAKIDEYRSRK